MATPRRSSARIRARTPGKTPEPVNTLGSLIERDETPSNEQSMVSAVSTQAIGHIPGAFESDSFLMTPSSRLKPGRENMHPSKVQQSTSKTTDQGLMLGFSDIKSKEAPATIEDTPSKSKLASAGFEFKFAHPENDLAAETRRIMESVREEAAKIKEQMRRERDEQKEKDQEGGIDITGRKIAQPKSRFSDVHKAQFSKMDSIASHPSIWKMKTVTTSAPLADNVPSQVLKRTQSKAELTNDRPENPAPSKRVRASGDDDVSSARPVSRDGSSIPRRTNLSSTITTPTKASLARSASAKSLRSTKIPGLHHSKSSRELVTPKKVAEESVKDTTKDPVTRSLFGLKKAISMKSILSKPQPKYSDDPLKIAAGTHLPLQEQATGTPVKATKRVGFAENLVSPSPVRTNSLRMPTKVLTPYKKANTEVAKSTTTSSPLRSLPSTPLGGSPTRKATVPAAPVLISPRRANIAAASEITSPSPRKIMVPVSCSKVPSSTSTIMYPTLKPIESITPRPGDFTFRADRQIRFSPHNTIRAVRPSGVPTVIAPLSEMPSVPHGMPNKKRARPDDDEEEENRENHPPVTQVEGSPTKKLRVAIGQDIKPSTPNKRLVKPKPASAPGSGKKGGLSLSRLNFLSRPKNRA